MKKLALVLVLVLAFALPVLANPFVDVPLNHWAYDSVQSLAAKGVIVGYPDGTFGGVKSLTRYEFAEAVAKALAFVETKGYAVADDVAILEKLAIEFADELASLGVTVADLEASLGVNSEAIAALKTTVAKLDTFFEPVVITGDFEASYEKVVYPTVLVATLTDETNINIEATINNETTAGISIEVVGLFAGAPVATWNGFFIDYQGEDLQLRVGEIDDPGDIGLGLIYAYDTYQEEFDGFLATWVWGTENDLGNWTIFGDVEDFYIANIAIAVGDEDEVTVGVTGSYDLLAGEHYVGGADLAFSLGDEDEVSVAVEGAVFYDTAPRYAAAISIGTTLDDLSLSVDAYYVLPDFVPTNSDFTEDTIGVGVEASLALTDEVVGTLTWNYEMDSAMAAATAHDVKGKLVYTIDADTEEEATVWAKYYVLSGDVSAWADYMNYPLADDFVFSGAAEYDYDAATTTYTYAGVATVEYALAEDMGLTIEGRIDEDGAALWSAEIELAYALAENTELTVGYEQNTWSDDLKDYDDMTIDDDLGTVTAGLSVSF